MKRLFALSFCCFFAFHTQAQDYEELAFTIDYRLDSIFKNHKAPGVSFSVVFPDGTARTFVKGFANVEKKLPMTTSSKMLGGSTGKVFYSVVALQLVEEGKISLDQPIFQQMKGYDWFDRLPNARTLTVRHLMRHQTGIPRYVFKPAFQEEVVKDVDKVWKPAELLSYVLDDDPLFEVGTRFEYSDTNYIIVAMLMEEVTGEELYELVQKRVLDKAGLKDVVPQNKRNYADLAQGYNADNDPFYPGHALDENEKTRYNIQFEWAGGGLVITTHDLAVLAKKIYEGEMFDKALLDEYLDGVDAGQLGGEWGLGVHIQRTPEGKTFGHSGFMPGYITNMRYYQDDRYAVCYQINTSDRSKMSIMRGLSILSAMVSEELNK